MLDFQGTLLPREEIHSLDGLTLGTVMRKGERGVILTSGNQRLDGKITELKQPLAVMKRTNNHRKHTENDMLTDRSSEGDISQAPEEFVIVGLIRKKIVFSHRC